MKLYEFMSKNDWQGELVLNGHSFENECSFDFGNIIITSEAIKQFNKVLNATLKGIEGSHVYFENENFSISEMKSEASELLRSVSGYISVEKYEKFFTNC